MEFRDSKDFILSAKGKGTRSFNNHENPSFKEVVKKAWVKAEKNEVLMNLMKRANFKEADTNDEVLVIMYNKLKEYV
jgi:hypothetical protein